jgi:hypothetical protein
MNDSSNLDLIIPELQGSKIRRTPDGRFSIYDLIRICGGVKNPHQFWNGDQKERKDGQKKQEGLAARFPELLHKTESVELGIGKAKKKTPVAGVETCLVILGLLPGACGQAYREKAANIVRRYIQGDADLGLEIMLRDHNKERVERAKERLLVSETNKQTVELAKEFSVSYGKVHNDRYFGLYREDAASLRAASGIKPSETPLDVLSTYDLTLNSLANQMAKRANNPKAIFDAANNLRQAHEQVIGTKLVPVFEKHRLRPCQAKTIAFGNNQLELPNL